MHCLVIGGAGFIGSNIVDALVEKGHDVRVFDLPNISTENLRQHIDSIEIMCGDFYNSNDVSHALKNIDVVVHLAYTTLPGPSNENPVYDIETNVVGTVNLLQLAVDNKVKKVVFASSGGTVYGIPESVPTPETHPTNPTCSYGITKLTIEKYLSFFNHLYGLNYTILRIGNPYGERQRIDNVQGAVAVFMGKVLRQEPITIWGDGSVARDYFHISDLSDAFVKVISENAPSLIYNIAGGHAYSINDILSVIGKVAGISPKVNFTEGRRLDVPVNCLDISLAKKELAWRPKVTLEAGVARFWDWLQQNQE